MSEGVSQSRFYMWRAVIAMVHADHVVTIEEKELAESYLDNVPFSEEQLGVLRQDLLHAQGIEGMFSKITDPMDQGEFFGFARLMVWCDGDFDRQEEEIFNCLKDIQMSRLDPEALRGMVQQSREVFDLDRLREDEAFQNDAKDTVNLGRLLDALKRNVAIREV